MKKEKSEHKNYIDMEVYLADIKRYRETAETQKMLLDKLVKENKNLKEKVETLELWLDNKEKLNEEYRKELEKLKSTYVYDAKQVRDIC